MNTVLQKRSPSSIRLLCEAAPDYGVAVAQCLHGTGLVSFDLYDTQTSISLDQEIRAIANFISHAPDRPGLGIEIARRYKPEVFGIWGYAILSSPTLRAALQTAIKFASLSAVIARIDLNEHSDPPAFLFDTSQLPHAIRRFVLERHLTVLSNFLSQLLPDFSLSKCVFQTRHTAPQFATTITQMLGFKVVVGCDVDAIIMPQQVLDMPLPQHDPAAMAHSLRQCHGLLQLTGPNWSERVRDATLINLNKSPSVTSIAEKLGLTERSLRRRLAEEGTSFRQILLETRLSIAHELLQTAGLDVSTVAWRVGYAEASSFVRAFSNHYGYAPGRLKQRA